MNKFSIKLMTAIAGLGLCINAATAADAPSFVSGGELVVCVDPTFPPLEYMKTPDAKEPSGFDIDLIEALAELWGVKKKLVLLDFSGLLPALEAKRCDMKISGAVSNPERLQKFGGTPYLNTGYIIVGRADAAGTYDSYEAFGGKAVAIQAGSLLRKVLEKANVALKAAGKTEITIQAYTKATDVMQQVLNGRVIGGTTLDSEFAFRDLQQPGKMKVLFADPEKQQYTAFFRKTPAGDQQIVDNTISKLIASGKMEEIRKKWNLSPSAFEGIGE